MAENRLESLLHREGRLRSGWRIAIYFFFFVLLAIAGQLAISPLPRAWTQSASLVVLTAAALAAGWLVLSRFDDRPLGALGFALHRPALFESLSGLAIGGALIVAAVLLLLVTRSAHFVPDTGTAAQYATFLGSTLLFFAVAAAFEEALFRGYPFQALVEGIGAWPATLLASALFALLHAANPNVTRLALVNIFLAGILLSVAYLRTRSLWFATGVHLGWNWTMASLLDFPVSGLSFETPLYTGVPTGADVWTGGAFGPEAGLVGTIVLVLGTVWLLRSERFRPAPETQRLDPIVDRRVGPGGF
jgi:uncharacterized protein